MAAGLWTGVSSVRWKQRIERGYRHSALSDGIDSFILMCEPFRAVAFCHMSCIEKRDIEAKGFRGN